MEYFPMKLYGEINEFHNNLKNLNSAIKEFSKTSNRLQRWLIFWTSIMALAVIGQIIVILVTAFG